MNLDWRGLNLRKFDDILIRLCNAVYKQIGGARGVMVIVAGIGHGDTSSNPGLIAFHIALIPLRKV